MTAAAEQKVRLNDKIKRELGELICDAIAMPTTEDVLLNPDGTLWLKEIGQHFRSIGNFPESRAMSAICTIAAMRGTVINHEHPILETELPLDGSRFEAIVPPVTRAPVFAIRVRARKIYTLAEYEQAGILKSGSSPHNSDPPWMDDICHSGLSHGDIIRSAVLFRQNILIVGATASGKTTLLNAVLAEIAELTPRDRAVLIEDTVELQCGLKNFVDLHSIDSGEHQVSMLQCLRATMRLRPTRIIVGEVRGGEAHSLLKAWNTGHPGGIATVHANDAIGGLRRLESLIGEAPESAGLPQQKLIAEAVNLLIFVDLDETVAAGRRVREVAIVKGWTQDGGYDVKYV